MKRGFYCFFSTTKLSFCTVVIAFDNSSFLTSIFCSVLPSELYLPRISHLQHINNYILLHFQEVVPSNTLLLHLNHIHGFLGDIVYQSLFLQFHLVKLVYVHHKQNLLYLWFGKISRIDTFI